MSTNLQVRAIMGGFKNNAMMIIDGGTMQIGEDVICIPTHDGFLNKDGRIIENANENVKGR